MKLQIDTINKTLKLEESVNLGELAEALNKLFPNNEWKEYKMETNTIINNWSSPIVIREYPYRTYPWWSTQPYYSTGDFQVTANAGNGNFKVSKGVYNVSY